MGLLLELRKEQSLPTMAKIPKWVIDKGMSEVEAQEVRPCYGYGLGSTSLGKERGGESKAIQECSLRAEPKVGFEHHQVCSKKKKKKRKFM